MSSSGELVPLRRSPARHSRLPVALARRALHDPRTTAVVAAAVTIGAERGVRELIRRLPAVRRRARGVAGIEVEWVSYVVHVTGRSPRRR